jgi:hypothetical protein
VVQRKGDALTVLLAGEISGEEVAMSGQRQRITNVGAALNPWFTDGAGVDGRMGSAASLAGRAVRLSPSEPGCHGKDR